MTLPSSMLPRTFCSISIPHIFLSPTYMSFGHLIMASMPFPERKLTIASAAASLTANCLTAGRAGNCPEPNLTAMLNVRFLPASLAHTLPFCPLPAVWNPAATTDIMSMSSSILRAALFVESIHSYHIIKYFSPIGADFVVYLSLQI